MTSVEILRLATSLVFGAIMVVFRRSALRAAQWAPDLRPAEALMGATFLLAGNRLTYAAIAQWDAGDADAINVCQIYALVAAGLMLLAGMWANRVRSS